MTALLAGPYDVAGATLVPARAARAQVGRAVLHVVPVLHSDGPITRAALCGYRPKRYPWVLRPTWPDAPCPLCAEREQLAGEVHDVPCDTCGAPITVPLSATAASHGGRCRS